MADLACRSERRCATTSVRCSTRLTGAPDAGPGSSSSTVTARSSSLNDDAATWLEDLGGGLPEVVVATQIRAYATGQVRTRARGASGRWLVCHASCLRGVDGRPGETALVIEPATAAELAPLIAEAYELSPASARSPN